jgi:hypothetical protein
MNERIRELHSQCKVCDKDTVLYFDYEKFAELIVRECANMAESFHRHQYDFTGNLELHEFIKTHFGVEE